MSKTNYKIGHLMGTLYAEYPTLLYRGSKDAVLQAGHTFVRICDQVTVHRELMDYDEVMFSLILAEKLILDANLISPGSIFVFAKLSLYKLFPFLYQLEFILELNVKVERYNLYEQKNSITALTNTLKDVDGIILASTVEWYGVGGYIMQFLDAKTTNGFPSS